MLLRVRFKGTIGFSGSFERFRAQAVKFRV